MFINIKGSCQCLQIKTLMGDFSSVYCSILSKMVCTVLDDFLWEFYENFMSNNFLNKHWPQSCLCPFKALWPWPFDPKISRAHPWLMGSLYIKFHYDRCKEKSIMRHKPISFINALWHWPLTFGPPNPEDTSSTHVFVRSFMMIGVKGNLYYVT